MAKKVIAIIVIAIVIAIGVGLWAWQQQLKNRCISMEGDAQALCELRQMHLRGKTISLKSCDQLQGTYRDECLVLAIKTLEECDLLASHQDACKLAFVLGKPEPSGIEFSSKTIEEYCATLSGDQQQLCIAETKESFDCSVIQDPKIHDDCAIMFVKVSNDCAQMRTTDMLTYCESLLTLNLDKCAEITEEGLKQKCMQETFHAKKLV